MAERAQAKRIAFLNCHNATLFVADVEMSDTDAIQLTSVLAWLRDAGAVMLPVAEAASGPIGAEDVMEHLRASAGSVLLDAALAADPGRYSAAGAQPIAGMPVWPFLAEGDDGADRDVLLSSARLWGVDILLEALRVDDPDYPVPVKAVRFRHDRWVKAAGGSRLRATVHLLGEVGCYFVAAATAPM